MGWRVGAIFLVALVIFARFFVWDVTEHANQKTAQEHFNAVVNSDVDELQDQLEVYADTLYSGRALFMTDAAVSRQDWTNFVNIQNIKKRYPGVNGISYVSLLNRAQAAQFTVQLNASRLASDGGKTFAIYPVSNDKQLAVITYLAPADTNQQAIGYDLLTSPQRKHALDSARDTGFARASSPIAVTKGGNTSQAMLIVMAVYNRDNALTSIANRRAAVKGFVILSFYTQQMLDSIFKSAPANDAVSLKAETNNHILYNLGPDFSRGGVQKTVDVDIAGQAWQLNFSAPKTFGLPDTARLAPIIVVVSTIPFLLVLGFAIYYSLKFQDLKYRKNKH